MPFTPFHMGPALLVKSVAGRHFSILAFGFAQVAMDIEPLVGMLRDADVLHGPTHTYAGAVVIGAAVTFVAPVLSRPILRRWNNELALAGRGFLAEAETFRLPAVAIGAFAGTLSHVVLDSIMHADMHPLAPWTRGNALLSFISIPSLHAWCVGAGLLGVAIWTALQLRTLRAHRAATAAAVRPEGP